MKIVLKTIALIILGIVLALVAFRVAAALRESSIEVPDQGRLIETSMGQVYVEEVGDESAPPVLLIHGSIGWSRLWEETSTALANSGFRAISFDMAPMGYSDRGAADGYARDVQARRVLALVDALQIKPVLVAHSFGAGAGTEAVLQNQAAFAGYVVVDGAIGIGSDAGSLPFPLRSSFTRELAISATATNPVLTRKLLSLFIFKKERATPDYVDIIQQPFSRVGTTAAMADWLPTLLVAPQDALSTQRASYADLALPVGIIWGKEDTTTPLAQGEELLSLIADAQLTVMPGVGHIPQIEDPAAFQAALIAMLGSL